MFALIYCFLPILLIPVQILIVKKRESLLWSIRKGKVCLNCKEDLNLTDEQIMSRIMLNEDFSKLCVSCSRDLKIKSIKNPFIIPVRRFQKYLISKNSDKLNWIFFGLALLFILLDITLIFFGIRLNLALVYGTINLISWSINIYKTLYTTTEKPSE